MNRSTITIIMAILLSPMLMGIASAAEVQYIKINPHELDKNYNAHRVSVNITLDTVGNLAYVEEYYSVDSYGQPKPFGGIRHDEALTTNEVSFDIMRPRDKEGKEYTSMKAKVTLDNKLIFEEWVPLGSTFKINNLKKPQKNVTSRPVPGVVKKQTVLEKPNNTASKTMIEAPQAPGFGMVTVIVIVLSICIYRRKNIRR